MEDQLRLLVVDDHQMLIDGIKSLLRRQERFNVVAEALDAETALEIIREGNIDMVITDIRLPGKSGIDLVKIVKKELPKVKMLVLSMHHDQGIASEVLMSEADGYILKNTGKKELIAALEKIADHSTYFSREVLQSMMERMKMGKQQEETRDPLTPRELEVLELICEEYSSAQIADKLFISRRTVDTHRTHILEKTGSTTLVGLIKFAIRNRLVKEW